MKKTCPDTEMIGDYLEGNLSEKEKFYIQEHLAECEGCLDKMMVVNDLMYHKDDLGLEDVSRRATDMARGLVAGQATGLTDRLKKTIGKSVADLSEKVSDFLEFATWGTAELQAVRHTDREVSKDLAFLKKELNGIVVKIEIERIGPTECDLRLVIEEHGSPDRGIRSTLKEGDREMASGLSEDGEILFESIPFGRYLLIFEKDGNDVGDLDLEIAEKGCGTR